MWLLNPPSLAEGVAPLDGPVEPLEALPDLLEPGQGLPLRRVGADEASDVDDEVPDGGDAASLHPDDLPVALGLQQGMQEVDVLLRTDLGRGRVRPLPREHGQVGDTDGGDGVEGEALPQVLGVTCGP